MSIVSVEHLTKTYGEKVLFDDISFTIEEKQRIGLIGVNGTGKSSLLKVLAGLEAPDKGTVLHASRFRAEYLAQLPEFEGRTTVLEHLFRGDSPVMKAVRDYERALAELELHPSDDSRQARLFQAQQQMDHNDAWEAGTQAKTILSRLGIRDYDRAVGELSGGLRKRVALAAALIQPADLLILDEPTNHIDNDTVEWLEEHLSKYRGALLLVTHDRYFLDRVANRILELDRGRLFSFDGNYGYFLEKKAEREEQEAASEDKRQNLLRRELAWLRRGAKARTTKQKARIQRVEELRDRETAGPDTSADMTVAAGRLGKKVIVLDEVSLSFGDRTLIDAFSYIFTPGERIGIIGPNGSGKSTLLNLLAGKQAPDSGMIETGSTVKLAYYTQENEEMDPSLRVIEYIREAAEVIRTDDGETITASQMLERFLFNGSMQWTPISRLSGGERRRLYLLRTLMGEPNVLLLDEPTNDLDIQTLAVLEDYIERFPGTVLSVSHDRYFLDRTADRLLIFEGGGVIRVFDGTYSEYRDAAESGKSRPPETTGFSSMDAAATSREPAKPRKLSYKEQKEWEEMDGRIDALERECARLKREIAEAGSDFGSVQRLFEEEQAAEAELERAIERWTELSLLVEEIEGNSKK